MSKNVKEVSLAVVSIVAGGYLLINVVKGPSPLPFIVIGAIAGIALIAYGVKLLFPMPKLEFDSVADAAEFMKMSGASRRQTLKALKGHEDIVNAIYNRNAK